MAESAKKCMVCAKPVLELKGGICRACEDKIRREALGEQARTGENANRELSARVSTPPKSNKGARDVPNSPASAKARGSGGFLLANFLFPG